MSSRQPSIAIVGGGLAGSLAAIMLARRGAKPVVFERGQPHDSATSPGGRTINLALAARGIAALGAADAFAAIEPLLTAMAGRIVHDESGNQRFLAYGQLEHERIYSVSRADFNRSLYLLARDHYNVEYRFDHECVDIDLTRGAALLHSGGQTLRVEPDLLLAADGAGSAVRKRLATAGVIVAREDLLDHGYKELTVPADAGGDFALDPGGLHIWPRGGFMLIALPNLDRSFTATLFLPHSGEPSFASFAATDIRERFASTFPDALALMPDLAREFAERPVGLLGTVSCRPWRHRVVDGTMQVLLLGDAAHAIVPFHGQGLNAGFEDCLELDRLVERFGLDWDRVLPAFEDARADNVRAIAEMALENYVEMRDDVRDPEFELKKSVSFELERRFEGRFIPRYSMVMFHPEIGYAEAQRRGRIQQEILDAVIGPDAPAGDRVDLALAERLVAERL